VVEAVDREGAAPSSSSLARSGRLVGSSWFYDLMLHRAIGEGNVIATILRAMLRGDEGRRSSQILHVFGFIS
jgi:hypothetical protein